ncbi:GSCFA domain-containing protein [Falsiroseomonas sp. HW251]|uniref:GSCFA domain-containing protein n=1 Tax=Falsiroseomonas sp. HW251 TaxID=3390998 RepID=UPI003D31CAD8
MRHPYRAAPDRAFWERAVARDFSPGAVVPSGPPMIRGGERVASAGSCFAANIVPYLEAAGIAYVRTEQPHPALAATHVEALSYHKFSAAYGNVYTPRHLLQLVQRALGHFRPQEDRWYARDAVVDAFRPGLAFPASSDREFDLLTAQHLDRTIEAFRQADVFVFTLGLTEAWVSALDGAVFPACPGTIAGEYDPARHVFRNFTVAETRADLTAALALIRGINPDIRFILTVSPVPLVATATDSHVLAATIYSKSALRVVAEEVTLALPWARYFPAYEIVTAPQAPADFFGPDRREVSRQAIDAVMGAFIGACEGTPAPAAPVAPPEPAPAENAVAALIARIECEEAAAAT